MHESWCSTPICYCLPSPTLTCYYLPSSATAHLHLLLPTLTCYCLLQPTSKHELRCGAFIFISVLMRDSTDNSALATMSCT